MADHESGGPRRNHHLQTEEHVEEWRDWALAHGRVRGKRAGTPLSVTSVDMSLARLKEALGRAVTRRLVYVNVAAHVTIPRRARKEERKTKEEVSPWNVQEVQKYIHGIRGERLYAALLLSLMGLRPAEVCGLRWEDVDLENAAIVIANTRTMMGNRYVVEKDTKSLAGERDLPLPALVLGALKAFRTLQAEEIGARGGRSLHDQATSQTRVPAYGASRAPSRQALRRTLVVLHLPGQQRGPGPHPCEMGRTYERKDDQAMVRQAGCGRSSRSGLHGDAAEGQE